MTKTEAIDRLASCLFSEIEYCDPSDSYDWDVAPDVNWERLPNGSKATYRNFVKRLLLERKELEAALTVEASNND